VEVLYVTHPAFAEHDTGAWHPERPARLTAAEKGVRSSGLGVRVVEAERVDPDLLADVHTPAYVAAIERFCAAGGGPLDADTIAVEASWDAALRAAGSGPQAALLLENAVDTTAFLAVRPPGHHALVDQAMGFCLFNNVVVTAAWLTARGNRVAIVDWDVHHGNGTQAMTWHNPDVMYVSTHQYPFYPMTGAIGERGGEGAEGTVINVPLPSGTAGDVYREVMGRVVVPAVRAFAPDWLLVSAGYDAHTDDPLADLRLVESDYGAMANSLSSLVPANRTMIFLEGGYHLAAITASVAQTLRGIAGIHDASEPGFTSPPAAFEVVSRIERLIG
jgi:acetoin utilization deacetylase AcuC-like enzyme